MTASTLNGINREALLDTVNALKVDPSIAGFRFRVHNRWINGGENRTEIDGYFGACEEHQRDNPFVLVNDEPPVLLGTDKGANPLEHLLHALAGCLTTTLVLNATARGIHLNTIETRFVGDLDLRGLMGLDDGVRRGFGRISVEVEVSGNADKAALEELCRVARQHSAVFDIIENGVPVMVTTTVTAPDSPGG